MVYPSKSPGMRQERGFAMAQAGRLMAAGLAGRLVICLLLTVLAFQPVMAAASPVLRKLDDQSFAALSKKRGVYLDVRVAKADELNPALRVYTGRFGDKKFSPGKYRIVKINAKRALVPMNQLSPRFQKSVLMKLWPKDRMVGDNWTHTVIHSQETLWSLAQWFTGAGKNYKQIKKASRLRSDNIGKGTRIKIPRQLLPAILNDTPSLDLPKPDEPIFSSQTEIQDTETVIEGQEDQAPMVTEVDADPKPAEPAQIPKPTTPEPTTQDAADETETDPKPSKPKSESIRKQLVELKKLRGDLRFGNDKKGRFGEYKLKSGEAIYSSVVVRFCGLIRAEDVRALAAAIIARNEITDETDLPIGFPIRIPYENLHPEFKAPDDAEYLSFIKNLEDVADVDTLVGSRDLEGVFLILDSGHGGRDPGAIYGKVWEDDFVYDIVCRIKKRIERETSATVITTVIDPSVNYKVQDVNRFNRDHDEQLLTEPRFSLNSPRVARDGVNLRWMIANNRYKRLLAEGIKPENVLFTSFHADSLHRTLRGSMLYIPNASVYPRKVAARSQFRKYKEYKGNHFTPTSKDMKKAQALSLNFADNFVAHARASGVRVHNQKAIRSLIYRNPTRPFVPAVIKYNRVPTRVLIEICNLNNKKDRNLLKRHQFRQKFADTYVESIYKTYGVPLPDERAEVLSQADGDTVNGD